MIRILQRIEGTLKNLTKHPTQMKPFQNSENDYINLQSTSRKQAGSFADNDLSGKGLDTQRHHI